MEKFMSREQVEHMVGLVVHLVRVVVISAHGGTRACCAVPRPLPIDDHHSHKICGISKYVCTFLPM